ncbi:MAG: flagellar protein FliS [Lachnospiraceae bacterium]|nr:flagellar protein FliS [Lachnospiraceae bacterium]
MTDEQKNAFKLRVASANKTEMVTIIYDILLTYLDDADAAIEKKDREERISAERHMRGCVSMLIESVQPEVPTAKDLYQIYSYIGKLINRYAQKGDRTAVQEIRRLVTSMRDTWKQVEKYDTDGPVMNNTKQIYAGMTYGPGGVANEYVK